LKEYDFLKAGNTALILPNTSNYLSYPNNNNNSNIFAPAIVRRAFRNSDQVFKKDLEKILNKTVMREDVLSGMSSKKKVY
jgi:hypothetical protein